MSTEKGKNVSAQNLTETICRELKKIKKSNKFIEKSFTEEEAIFIGRLIIHKPENLAFLFTLDHISQKYLLGTIFLNTASLRRIEFFKNFMLCKGNATQSAIKAGYSPKTAKQQGYRLLKWIQEHGENSI